MDPLFEVSSLHNTKCERSTAPLYEETTLLRIASSLVLGASILAAPLLASADPDNGFVVANKGTSPVFFYYGCRGQALTKTKTLPPGNSDEYWKDNGCKVYTIQIMTSQGAGGKTTFSYVAYAGKYYKIVWDKTRNAWNFMMSKEGE